VRATLYMSTPVAVRDYPVLKAFVERLRITGKAAKVALTACLRKLLAILNAMVTHHTPWQPQEVPSAYWINMPHGAGPRFRSTQFLCRLRATKPFLL